MAVEQLMEMLDSMKSEGQIVDYRLASTDVNTPAVPIDLEIVLPEGKKELL